jgi:hypothetical protein
MNASPAPTAPPTPTRQRWLLVALVLVGAGLRLGVNDVVRYSRADERHYVDYTRMLVADGFFIGYRHIVAEHLAHPDNWVFPPPLRWGYFALATVTLRLRGACDPRGLAWLSTLAGIAVLPLAFAVGRRLVGARVALMGVALCICSPLLLALGRRALSDELMCAAALVAWWTTLRQLERTTWARAATAIAAWTFLFAVKETAFVLDPALLALLLLERRAQRKTLQIADWMLIVLPPLLWAGIFCGLAHSLHDFVSVLHAHAGNVDASVDYSAKYQSGPPHRLLIDLLTLAPLTSLLAVAALTLLLEHDDAGARTLAVVTVAVVAAFSVAPAKNVRFAIAADPLLRLLAAWPLATRLRPRLGWALVALDGAIELSLFVTIFLVGNVYDPISHGLLEALHIIP